MKTREFDGHVTKEIFDRHQDRWKSREISCGIYEQHIFGTPNNSELYVALAVAVSLILGQLDEIERKIDLIDRRTGQYDD